MLSLCLLGGKLYAQQSERTHPFKLRLSWDVQVDAAGMRFPGWNAGLSPSIQTRGWLYLTKSVAVFAGVKSSRLLTRSDRDDIDFRLYGIHDSTCRDCWWEVRQKNHGYVVGISAGFPVGKRWIRSSVVYSEPKPAYRSSTLELRENYHGDPVQEFYLEYSDWNRILSPYRVIGLELSMGFGQNIRKGVFISAFYHRAMNFELPQAIWEQWGASLAISVGKKNSETDGDTVE